MIRAWKKYCVLGVLSMVAMSVAGLLFLNGCSYSSGSDSMMLLPLEQRARIRTFRFVRHMGNGWNLGNTFDNTVVKDGDYETGWGNPKVTRELIRFIKQQGFDTIRIPVTWGNRCGPAPDYKLPKDMLARVKQVVDWCLKEKMYVILNMHHEGGWINEAGKDFESFKQKYVALWNQIGTPFADYTDRLIFESMNEIEPKGMSVEEGCELINKINALFVETIHAQGGDNSARFLLLPGYCTDIDRSIDRIVFPEGARYCILSLHYYTPSDFTIAEPGTEWGYRSTWGTERDYAQLEEQMNKIQTAFLDKGMPVVLGEYGCLVRSKDPKSRAAWFSAVVKACKERGICPIFWDNGEELDRRTLTWRYPDVDAAFLDENKKDDE